MPRSSRLSQSTFATFHQGSVASSHCIADDVDDLMCECLERLSKVGKAVKPADLRQYLPDTNAIGVQGQRFVLVELIKFNMEFAAKEKATVCLDEYYEPLSDLISTRTSPLDLVMEEIQLRRESGQAVEAESYRDRFPQFARLLEPLLGPLLGPLSCSHSSDSPGQRSERASRPRKASPSYLPELLPEGCRIDDFEIIQTLGSGAFAYVYLARQLSMSRLVALKVSLGSGAESKALAQFDHPNIVRVFDQRVLTSPPAHLLYMQFHPGGTLAEVVTKVREQGTLATSGKSLIECVDTKLLASAQIVPEHATVRAWLSIADWPKVVAWIGVQLARSLQVAHDNGVLHCDVKPANVLLSAEAVPQLADFNVSMTDDSTTDAGRKSIGGSIGYMAPEHLHAITGNWIAQAPRIAERADLYSLGVLLWELWQGKRPFDCSTEADSWTSMVHDQLQSRDRKLIEPVRDGTASQRVLEAVLRSALSSDPNARPISGSEMAGSLRLAVHPEAAKLFDPDKGTWAHLFSRLSPWYVAIILILVPNMLAGFLNFKYNSQEIEMNELAKLAHLEISDWVNFIAFPIGAILVVVFTAAIVRALKNAETGKPMDSVDLTSCLQFGYRAALIDGGLWLIAGIVFPLALFFRLEEFTLNQASHFFISSLMCGGIAMVYPFFTITLLCTRIYYPKIVRPNMEDKHFSENAERIIKYCESFILIAGLIPLLGAMLLLSTNSDSRGFLMIAIVAAMIAACGAFFAYRQIVHTWSRLADVLSTSTNQVPGG